MVQQTGGHRFDMGGVACSTHSIADLLADIEQLTRDRTRQPRGILCVNAHIYCCAMKDERLRAELNAARIVAADGMGIVLAARLFGERIRERCNMTEALRAFLAAPCELSHTAVVIGCDEDQAARAGAEINARSKHCKVVATFSGYLSDEEYRGHLAKWEQVDLILLGMGTPRTEQVAELAWRCCPNAIVWHVGGGTIKILAGAMVEAPAFWRRAGLQWLHRFVREPDKIVSRGIVGFPVFAWHAVRMAWRTRGQRRPGAGGI